MSSEPSSGAAMREVLETRIRGWVEDPESSVEYAEEVEGRWAVRMHQTVRDATTVWFTVGQRSITYEAYALPAAGAPADLLRLALTFNRRSWRAFYALDAEEGLVLRGRLAAASVTPSELDLVLGEIYEAIETGFRQFVLRLVSDREKST